MHKYPKYKFHPGVSPVVVHSKKDEDKLGKDWFDSPADFGVETCPGVDPDQEIAKKKKHAEAKVK